MSCEQVNELTSEQKWSEITCVYVRMLFAIKLVLIGFRVLCAISFALANWFHLLLRCIGIINQSLALAQLFVCDTTIRTQN